MISRYDMDRVYTCENIKNAQYKWPFWVGYIEVVNRYKPDYEQYITFDDQVGYELGRQVSKYFNGTRPARTLNDQEIIEAASNGVKG